MDENSLQVKELEVKFKFLETKFEEYKKDKWRKVGVIGGSRAGKTHLIKKIIEKTMNEKNSQENEIIPETQCISCLFSPVDNVIYLDSEGYYKPLKKETYETSFASNKSLILKRRNIKENLLQVLF